MTSDNLPATEDTVERSFDLVEKTIEKTYVTADGDVLSLSTETYQFPEKTKNVGNRFLPGALWKGNAKGRAKGTKNRITLERLLTEEHLRQRLAVNAEDILEKAIQEALKGDPKLLALLLDKLMATPKNTEDGDSKDNAINITITNATAPDKKPVATVSPGKVRVITTDTQIPIDGDYSK